MATEISHIGIAVRDVHKAAQLFADCLDTQMPQVETHGDMKVALLHVAEAMLELMEPIGDSGVLSKYLAKNGEGIHHICFQVDDIASTLKRARDKGIELVDKEPRLGIEGKIAFLHPRSTHGVLIEFVEK